MLGSLHCKRPGEFCRLGNCYIPQLAVGTCDGSCELNYRKLTPEEERVIVRKGTEPPFSGQYDDFYQQGIYVCKRCNEPLFSSSSKFDAGCGWPAFDDSFPHALRRLPDPDGMRTEIECAKCGAHLGHEFLGEGLTRKNARECVNSLSIRFIASEDHK